MVDAGPRDPWAASAYEGPPPGGGWETRTAGNPAEEAHGRLPGTVGQSARRPSFPER